MNSGYDGFSMSWNARYAYADGEQPLSRWTKSAILDELKNRDCSLDVRAAARGATAAQLKAGLLEYSSWHHTSKYFNETDFYAVKAEIGESTTVEEITEMLEKAKRDEYNAKQQAQKAPERWECRFLEWSGTRNYPKATEYTEVGEIRGNWFYRANGEKKSIKANGFVKIRRIDEPDKQQEPPARKHDDYER